jgi:hypothetical protein
MTRLWRHHLSASFLCTLALAGLIGAGQATAQSTGDSVREGSGGRASAATGAAAAACMPPGMPALDELVTVGNQALFAPVEGGDTTVMVNAIGLVTRDHLARNPTGDLSLDFIVYYVQGKLAAVDDHPGDPTAPDLVDTGMVTAAGAMRAQGTPSCQWARLAGPSDAAGAATSGTRI